MVKSTENDARKLLDCYNSAIQMHDENSRADGDTSVILDTIKDSESYHMKVDDKVIGWIVWKNEESFSVLKAMYVREIYQGKGLSKQMLEFYFSCQKEENKNLSILSVLINAPWAIRFYEKNQYTLVEPSTRFPVFHKHDIEKYIKKHNKPWVKNMYKEI